MLYENETKEQLVAKLKKAGEELDEYRARLGDLVKERTASLAKVNQQLTHEIKERKKAEQALKEWEQMLKLVLDTIPVRVFWKNLDSSYLGCNRPFALDAGLQSPEEIVGRNDFEMGWVEQAEIYRADDRLVMETGHPKLGYQELLTVPDGSRIWRLTNKVPMLDAEGSIKGVLGTYEDITKHKRAEEALRESEERYRVIFENSPLGITHFDQNGNVVSCNRQFLNIVGAPKEKVIGFNVFRSLQDPAMLAAFMQALSGRTGYYEGDYRSVTGDKITPLRVIYSRLTTDDGKLLGTVGIWEDITERKRAEAARRELSRQRFHACNVLAHELRNSLIKIGFVFPAINSVMGFLREQWELELRKVLPDQEDKNALLLRLGELLLMGEPYLGGQKELTQVCEELLAEQVVVANAFFLPKHGKAWLDNKIRPKWHRLLAECRAWDEYKEEVVEILTRLEAMALT